MASVRELISSSELDREVVVKGWVRTRRDAKGLSFIEVNDGTCFSSIQVVAEESLADYAELIPRVNTGTSVSVTGLLRESLGKGQRVEIIAHDLQVVGDSGGESYPLQKKRHSNEFLRTIAHLRPRTNTFGAVFRLRNRCSYAIHSFFQERGFLYVHTPIITSSDCEGAGTLFRVTTLPFETTEKVSNKDDFFGKPTYLTVSGQLELETYACALSKVYTFGPTFRAENSNTPRHLAEFWMVEPEVAFCDLLGDMELAEQFVRYIISDVLENCSEDLEFFDRWVEKGLIDNLKRVVSADFQHLTYDRAVEVLQKSGKKFEFPVEWGSDLQTEHERYLTEEFVKSPVFVTNYPKEIKAFYMRLDEDERTVSAMDLLVPGLGEIIGGSQREDRLDVIENRIRAFELDPEEYSWYCDLRRFGSVPHAGFGLGLERLVMYLSGIKNIRDVIPFPRTPGNAAF